MSQRFTPLIKKLGNGGTLITFQSASEDMGFTFNNAGKGFAFSKFALLDIPSIVTPTDGQNTIQFKSVEGSYAAGLSSASPFPEGDRVDLAESLQNYMLNLETLLIGLDTYDPSLDLTVSERVFWKWLKEIGAIRYRASNNTEKTPTLSENRFVEEDNNTDSGAGDLYSRVVKYIGEIDLEGNSRSNTNATKEVYVYVPTICGGTPFVQFKCIDDNNYTSGMTIGGGNTEYIQGQSSGGLTGAGLRTEAFYDMDALPGVYAYIMNSVSDEYWFMGLAPNGPNAYFTDENFEDATVDTLRRQLSIGGNQIDYKRSRLDGVCIDFDMLSYKPLSDDLSIKSFADWNASASANAEFGFNTVLLYYDVFDIANPSNRTTNLFGILFIDNVESVSAGGSKIPTFTKQKPDILLGRSGNGYSLRTSVKFDSVANNVDVEVSVNDSNTFSMLLFAEAMGQVSNMVSKAEQIVNDNIDLKATIQNLETVLLSDKTKDEVYKVINDLKSQVAQISTNSGLAEIVSKINKKVEDIISGKYELDLGIAFSFIQKDGIYANKQGDSLIIGDNKQKYGNIQETNLYVAINDTPVYNIFNLYEKSNLVYHRNSGIQKTATSDISIYINDSDVKWKTNQSYTIVLDDSIDFGNYGVKIFTDAKNTQENSAPYKQQIGIVPHPSQNAIIEIICIDETNMNFLVISK